MSGYESYSKNAVVLKVRLSGRIKDSDPPGEGSLDLKVSGVDNPILHCFMDNDAASLFYRNQIVVGDVISVLFVLSGDYVNVSVLKEKMKELAWIEMKKSFSNHYTAKGEIMNIVPHPEMSDSNRVILDCGISIVTRISKLIDLKVGNYVQISGRLDANIIGKVK